MSEKMTSDEKAAEYATSNIVQVGLSQEPSLVSAVRSAAKDGFILGCKHARREQREILMKFACYVLSQNQDFERGESVAVYLDEFLEREAGK